MKSIQGLPDGVVGIQASGRVTGEDYELVLQPEIERALQHHPKVRLLYQLDPEFTGFTVGALVDDAKVGLGHRKDIEKCAVVTDAKWIDEAIHVFRVMFPCPVKVFPNERLAEAKVWIAD
ncbi:MAG: STAS/SEC14 domain-containing protein [Polyangiaceae bacterium]